MANSNLIYVQKKQIISLKVFKELISLYNLSIAYEEPLYYFLTGEEQDVCEFQKYWRDV